MKRAERDARLKELKALRRYYLGQLQRETNEQLQKQLHKSISEVDAKIRALSGSKSRRGGGTG